MHSALKARVHSRYADHPSKRGKPSLLCQSALSPTARVAKMGAKSKNAISKRRPRQNIIALILKSAKKQGGAGSSTSASTASSANAPRPDYYGNKRGLLQSAVDLTRRSKNATSRGAGGGGRRGRGRGGGGKRTLFVKGQRAFYRSAKGIAKVTVVGIHHDAKLEPYYSIQLRDGKEKQTDGKHLTPIQEDVKEKDKKEAEKEREPDEKSENESVKEMKRSRSRSRGRVSRTFGIGDRSRKSPARGGGHCGHGGEATDPLSDSDEEELVIDYTDQEECVPRGTPSHDAGDAGEDNDANAKKFEVGQDAYYRKPSGGISKVRILSEGDRPHRYTVGLPDDTFKENVPASRLATLMDLSSQELSLLMNERNQRQRERRHSYQPGSSSRESRPQSLPARSGRYHPHSSSAGHAKFDRGDPEEPLALPAVPDEEGGYDAAEEAEEPEPPSSIIDSEPSSLSRRSGDRRRPSADAPLGDESEGKVGPLEEPKKKVLALPCPVKMVEAKTEDGGWKTVPLYEVGMSVFYKNAAGTQPAEILAAHLDDLLDPFYDVRLEDGREKQTDNAHISLTNPDEERGMAIVLREEEADAKNEEEDQGSNGEVGHVEEGRHDVASLQKARNQEPEEEDSALSRVRRRNDQSPLRISARDSLATSLAAAEAILIPDSSSKNLKASVTSRGSRRSPGPASDAGETSVDPESYSAPAKRPQDPATSVVPAAAAAANFGTSTTPVPAALVPAAQFVVGDEVLYTSSAGERLSATVARLQRDRKNRPYYVLMLPSGKEKQVYGHRLKPLSAEPQHPQPPPQDPACGRRGDGESHAGGSRGRSRAGRSVGERSRGRSKCSRSIRGDAATAAGSTLASGSTYGRTGSVGSQRSRASILSNSSRRSMASRDRAARATLARDHSVGSVGSRRSQGASRERSVLRGSSVGSEGSYRDGRSLERSRPSGSETITTRSVGRSRSRAVAKRSKSISSVSQRYADNGDRKHRRSHSRAPSEDLPAEGHHQGKVRGRSGRPTAPSVSMSSRKSTSRGDHHSSTGGGDDSSRSTGRSLSKLRSFRKSFAGVRKH